MKKKKNNDSNPKMPSKQQQKEWSTTNQEIVFEFMESLRNSGFQQPVFDMVFTDDITMLEPKEFVWNVIGRFLDVMDTASSLGDYFFCFNVDDADTKNKLLLFLHPRMFQEGRRSLLAWIDDRLSSTLAIACRLIAEGLRGCLTLNINCYKLSPKTFQEGHKATFDKICSYIKDIKPLF